MAFIDALEATYGRIARNPSGGSPRYAHELNLPELRVWQVPRYPYLVFYVESVDHIDIWRILHARRDMPAWIVEPDSA